MNRERLPHYHFAASSISSDMGHAINHFGADTLIRLLKSRPGRFSPEEIADPALAAHNTIAWAMESVQSGCNGFDLRRPTMTAPSVGDIDFNKLSTVGIRFLLIDLDATLVEPFTTKIDLRGIKNINQALESKVLEEVCIVSNVGIYPYYWRLEQISTKYGFLCHPCWWPLPIKPNPLALIGAIGRFASPKASIENTIMVGDQSWTDIAAANHAGIFSILVPPLGPIPQFKAKKYTSQAEFLTCLKMRY